MNLTSAQLLAINLKYYRYKSGLSQIDFAFKLHLSMQQESKLENARLDFTAKTLDKLTKYISELENKKITQSDLLIYSAERIITEKRIDTYLNNKKKIK